MSFLSRIIPASLVIGSMLGALPSLAAEPAACPAKPMRVVRSTGDITDYHGTVAAIPELCRLDRPDGSGGAFYYGSWRSDWPGAGDALPALRTAIDGPKGTRASFTTHSIPGWQWHDTIINEGTELLTVGGKTYTVLVIAHEREGFDGNTYHSIIRSWRDVATGMVLKVVETQISGQSYGPATTWTATQVLPIPMTAQADAPAAGRTPG
jgi:hypothetical protein